MRRVFLRERTAGAVPPAMPRHISSALWSLALLCQAVASSRTRHHCPSAALLLPLYTKPLITTSDMIAVKLYQNKPLTGGRLCVAAPRWVTTICSGRILSVRFGVSPGPIARLVRALLFTRALVQRCAPGATTYL